MPKIEIQDVKSDYFHLNQTPILLFAGKLEGEEYFYGPPQMHDYCEILYVMSGTGSFLIDGKAYEVKPGDLILYSEGVPHEERSVASPFELIYCGLTRVKIEGLAPGRLVPPHIEPILHSGIYSPKVEAYLTEIMQECSSQALGYETLCSTLLMSLITLIYRLIDVEHGYQTLKGKNEITLRTKQFIDRNYTRNLTLKDIADTFYVNQHYLNRLFRKDLNDSPINYLIHRRMEEAKRLLATTEQPIHAVAEAVGYENEKYFSMMFKKITEMTPGAYRKSHKNRFQKK